MKNLSEEKIEINGKEYTLFLNRKGLVAWEKFAKEEKEKISEYAKQVDNALENINGNENPNIDENTNPFEGIEQLDPDMELLSKTYRKLYWIMLYTNHKFDMKKVNELYDEAVEEYGEEQIIALGVQMVNDVNTDRYGVEENEPKKLSALRPM